MRDGGYIWINCEYYYEIIKYDILKIIYYFKMNDVSFQQIIPYLLIIPLHIHIVLLLNINLSLSFNFSISFSHNLPSQDYILQLWIIIKFEYKT